MDNGPMIDIENLAQTSAAVATIRPTTLERAFGRLMRGPEGHAEGAEGGEGSGASEGASKEGSAEEGEGGDEGETVLGTKVEKAEGDKGGEKAEAKDDGEAEQPNVLLGAPDGDYEIDAAKLPEGTKIDADALAVITPIAKEIGLSNEGMNRLAGAYATILPNVVKQISDGIEADAAAQTKAWADETKLAVEGGKDEKGGALKPAVDANGEPIYAGKSMAEVRQIAAKALDKLGTPELRQYLETTGLGNHEPLVRFAFKAGMAIKEDGFERGSGTSSKPATLQTALYGSSE